MSDAPRENFTTSLPSTSVEPISFGDPVASTDRPPIDEAITTADAPVIYPKEPAPEQEAAAAPIISDESWAAATTAWIDNHVRSSPLSQSSAAWNHLMRSLPLLKGFVETQLKR